MATLKQRPAPVHIDTKQHSLDITNGKHASLDGSKKSMSFMFQSVANSTKTPERSRRSPRHQNFFHDNELIKADLNQVRATPKNDLWIDLESTSTALTNLKCSIAPSDNEKGSLQALNSPSAARRNPGLTISPRRRISEDGAMSPELRVVMRRNGRYRTSAHETNLHKSDLLKLDDRLERELAPMEKKESISNMDKTMMSTQTASHFTLKVTKVLPEFHIEDQSDPHYAMRARDRKYEKLQRSSSPNLDLKTRSTKWNKLVHVFKSTLLFKREEVKSIMDVEDIGHEINTFQLRKVTEIGKQRGRIDITKEDFAREAFDIIRKVKVFCDCAAIGAPKHVEVMRQLINDDPKKFLLEPDDPNHLINRKNNDGHTPLYLAAKNGNLDVVQLLLDKKANCFITSQISKDITKQDTPLEAAVKWSHCKVVEEFLARGLYNKILIQKCRKLTTNPSMRTILDKYSRPSKSAFNFLACFKLTKAPVFETLELLKKREYKNFRQKTGNDFNVI